MKRLPFGVKPATGIFQREIEKVLFGIEGVINFLDDIIIAAPDIKTHNDRLRQVFDRLKTANLRLNMTKCVFAKREITFLGHKLSEFGLEKQVKHEAIINAPVPKNVNEVKAFCGMINYYGKFISNLATKMHPIYKLLKKKQQFEWDNDCQRAFDTIKKEVVSDTVLTHFNPDLPIILTCDASSVGIGAVLSHIMPDGSERPIEFASRILSKTEKNYGVIQQEALAIVYGTNKFYQFLIGKHFTLRTDHKPLLGIFGDKKGIPQMSASRMQRWAMHLSAFNFTIQHVSSNQNVADMLSRLPIGNIPPDVHEEPEATYLCHVENNSEFPVSYEEVLNEMSNDDELLKVIDCVQSGRFNILKECQLNAYYDKRDQLTSERGILLWGHRIVVPRNLRRKLLKQVHATHMGIVKSKAILRSYVWWPGIDKDVELLLKSCESCLLHSTSPPKVPNLPWPVPTRQWSRLHIDYAGPIKGVYLLIVIDAKSKWVEVFVTKEPTAEFTIRRLRELFGRFGLPDTVVSDNGSQFTAEIFKKFLSGYGIAQKLTAPGHPATNGAAENAVKTVKYAMYRIMHNQTNISIEDAINRFLTDYRNTPHSTTRIAPSHSMLGFDPKTNMHLMQPGQAETHVEDLSMAENKRSFQKGDTVIVRDYRNCNHPSWQQATIVRVLGPRNYTCCLQNGRLIKRHVDQIRLYHSVDDSIVCDLPSHSRPQVKMKQEVDKDVDENEDEQVTWFVVPAQSSVIIEGSEEPTDHTQNEIVNYDSDDLIYESCDEETNFDETLFPNNIIENTDLNVRNRRAINLPTRFRDYELY